MRFDSLGGDCLEGGDTVAQPPIMTVVIMSQDKVVFKTPLEMLRFQANYVRIMRQPVSGLHSIEIETDRHLVRSEIYGALNY